MRRFLPIAVVAFAISTANAQPAPETKPAVKTEVKADVKAVAKPAVAATPASMPTQVPATVDEAIKVAKDTFQAGKARNWWLMCAGIIWVLMFVIKLAGLLDKLGRRWGYILVAGLSMVAMLAAKFGGGISWEGAIAIMTSGPFMAFANDFFKRGILGKEPENTVNK